jgi:hypothetical protein
VYQCGPYIQNHSTAATFAFKKELLTQTSYDENNAVAEEKNFTKGYTIPLIQLNPLKSILVFSHKHNSLNKEKLLINPERSKIIMSPYNVDDFVKDPVLKQFYMHDMNMLLENYEPGRPENKPELLKQIKNLEEERNKRIEEHNKIAQQQILSNNMKSIHSLRDEYEKKILEKNIIINELLKKVKQLTNEVNELYKITESTK